MQELALLMDSGCLDARDEEFASLVKQAKAGDTAAFDAIMIRFERQVLGTALRLLNRNLEDAKDAAQQVFLRLHRSLHQLDESRHFASWLYRITVNVCRDMQRVRARRPSLSLEEVGEVAAAAGEDVIQRNEQRGMIYAALARLPERERTAVVLRDLEGLSTSEVARIMGCAEVTVRSQISNARVKMRKFVIQRQRRPR
ncbi:MAG TPA: sigma-70 family RNA polymerase sigma factor [Bryobacteraceae bacterium]|nr:sigma-70 family RNA polymerase sigma factor [Bryobacteraceae bacterium]